MAIKREIRTKARNGKWSTRTITVKGVDEHQSRIKIDDKGCHIYQGSLNSNGYAYPRIDGKLMLLHRAVYAHTYGPIPDHKTLVVCHKCGNSSCINPAHLYLGTYKDNAQDMVRHGTAGKLVGENIGNSKLLKEDVIKIRASNLSGKELAKKYKVTEANISSIKLNQTWRHI